ncbi:MAG: protein kinase [Phycisphaerales bacterium JB063]
MTAPDDPLQLRIGRKLGSRYVVQGLIGAGSEGSVYRIADPSTGIQRAAKIFRPGYDTRSRRSTQHARKLNHLRRCDIVLQYLHSETVAVRGEKLTALISELCEGVPLQTFIEQHPGKRLPPYMALHVLAALTEGLAEVHALGEYHADVHTENILIQPRGVRFELKLIDFYEWGKTTKAKQEQDILDTTRVLYDMLGGRPHYAKQPAPVRHICAGLQHKRILQRFPTIAALNTHLHNFPWETMR